MADWPVKSLGDKTLLQYAKTPYMDKLARMGRNGRWDIICQRYMKVADRWKLPVLVWI